MKKILLPLFACMLSFSGLAQDAIDQFYVEYAAKDNFTKVNISGKMFELFAHIEGETEDEKELLEAISNVKRLRVLSSDSLSNSKALYKEAISRPTSEYEILMTVDDNEEQFTFYIKESHGTVSELLMLAHTDANVVILSLSGNIDLNQLARISRAMDIDGLNYLEKAGQ